MNRDQDLWRRVATHPGVAPHIAPSSAVFDIGSIVAHPRVVPFADEHGGYLFFCLDVLGTVFEIHAMIMPQGRGRKAWCLLTKSLDEMFCSSARIVIAQEVVGNPMSRSPRSFGFEPTGDAVGEFRPWVLTKDAWFASRARKRMKKCLLS